MNRLTSHDDDSISLAADHSAAMGMTMPHTPAAAPTEGDWLRANVWLFRLSARRLGYAVGDMRTATGWLIQATSRYVVSTIIRRR